MGTFQQKLLLKGSEESIEYFTRVLKAVKDGAGFSTAVALVESLENWERCGSLQAVCGSEERWASVECEDFYCLSPQLQKGEITWPPASAGLWS